MSAFNEEKAATPATSDLESVEQQLDVMVDSHIGSRKWRTEILDGAKEALRSLLAQEPSTTPERLRWYAACALTMQVNLYDPRGVRLNQNATFSAWLRDGVINDATSEEDDEELPTPVQEARRLELLQSHMRKEINHSVAELFVANLPPLSPSIRGDFKGNLELLYSNKPESSKEFCDVLGTKNYACKVVDPVNFRHEVQQLLRTNRHPHPNVIQLMAAEFCGDRGRMYFIMGTPLSEALKRWTLTFNEVLRFSQNLMDGVAHLHKVVGVAHCDLKPANCVIVDAQLQILDFGNARRCDRRASLWPVTTCSTAMPAEFAFQDNPFSYDPRELDVWSATCCIFWMVFNKCPGYQRSNEDAEIEAHWQKRMYHCGNFPVKRDWAPRQLEFMSNVVLRGFTTESGKRATALELSGMLRGWPEFMLGCEEEL